jgi:transcriptional regulator with XRE-family HTH domain
MTTWDEYVERTLAENEEVRREYDRLGPLYGILSDVLGRRAELGLSQKDLAARMGKQQPAIARFEAGNAENPTLGFLQQLAEALDMQLSVHLVPRAEAPRRAMRAAEERATYSPS